MKRRAIKILIVIAGVAVVIAIALCGLFASFPRPYRDNVEESGLPPALVYAVMKAESGFREDAQSGAGAVGLMQLLPSTAEFIAGKEGIVFERERLSEGEYNLTLGCMYLTYLLEKFPSETAALAAYNAGEGTVREWLKDGNLSEDGIEFKSIPYPETAGYLKKVKKFRKIYEFLYRY